MKFFSLIITISLGIFFSSLHAQSLCETLTNNSWKGEGKLMGMNAEFQMDWTLALDEKFMHLDFHNKMMIPDREPMIFKAQAYYRIANDSIVDGQWFDSRGYILPLKGTINDNKLVIYWGDEKSPESGKTTYTLLENGSIKTVDYISNESGYGQFGEAIYQKHAKGED